MEKNNFIFKKVSSFLPSSFSSCQFRSLPDVAEGSITITKANKKIQHEIDHSSFLKKSQKTPQNSSKPSKQTQKKNDQECRKGGGAVVSINHSSSSYGGWFTSSDEKARPDDVSMSSNSGDSFRLKTSRRFRRCEEMKSIDETGRCSFSSSFASVDTVLSKCSRKTAPATAAAAAAKKTTATAAAAKKSSKNKPFPEYDLSSDHISTQLYYSKGGGRDSGKSLRRRKTSKNRRKVKKSREKSSFEYGGSMVGESYAVEKSSSDPHGDFRASMVEMIVEKQIFGADDLERLLLCFLSLNAASYHGIIYQVFTEICQTLFTN
ncbi:hypothetical protein ACP275_01G024300 [Erythranthe tilingii]